MTTTNTNSTRSRREASWISLGTILLCALWAIDDSSSTGIDGPLDVVTLILAVVLVVGGTWSLYKDWKRSTRQATT